MRRFLVLALFAALLAGCGSEDSSSGKADGTFEKASKEDAEAMERIMQTFDGKEACEKLMTPEFVRNVFGGMSTCIKQVSGDGKKDESTLLKNAETDGDEGRATVSIQFAQEGTATGSVLFSRASGDWQVKDFGNDFLRSLLSGGLSAGIDKSFSGVAQTPGDDVRGCLRDAVTGLPDARVRSLGYAAFRQDKTAAGPLQVLLFECLGDSPTGREALRKAFEQGIQESADADDKSGRLAKCVLAELRESLSSEAIAKAMIKRTEDNKQVGPEITGPIAKAQRACI